MQNIETAHFNMVEQQVRPSDVSDPRILTTLSQIKRDDFLDDELQGLAYADTCLPIGYGQVMLSPVIEGRLLQALNVQADEEVLELGTGSGYFTALLACLAKHITSVEIIPELSEQAAENLSKIGIENVDLLIGDASRGWSLADRVDVIVATAAFAIVTDDYLQSLAIGGRMLVVVGDADIMNVQVIRRVTEWEWQTDAVFETSIPLMINAESKPVFEF